MDKWIKKIRREVKKSPAKAAVLGSLVLVAVVIWGSKLAATPGPTAQNASVVGVSVDPQPKIPQVASAQEEGLTITEGNIELRPWEALQMWRLQPSEVPVLERDPFAMDAIATVEPSNDAPAEVISSPSPEDLGIRFTGVVISRHYRTAIFQNQPVCEGSVLKVERDGRSHFVKILEVSPTGVKFSIDGVDFEQAIPTLGIRSNGTDNGP